MRIVTELVRRPLPIRDFDYWIAFDADCFDEAQHVGYGRTEQQAIDNLHEIVSAE